VVYGIILAPLNNPEGINIFTNAIHHYFTPAIFILDFLYTERRTYSWKFLLPWLIYPHLYYAFSFISGITTGDYIYFFLDFDELGIVWYLIWYGILISLFLFISSIYITYNTRLREKLFPTN
jgi:hypothetical protein